MLHPTAKEYFVDMAIDSDRSTISSVVERPR